MGDGRSQLDALDAGDAATSVRAVFSWSCRQLSEPAARMFRLLGLHPGPEMSLRAAASMAGVPVTQAKAALGELTAAHLMREEPAGRFASHDLLRAYAAEQCVASDPVADRSAAIRRVLDHYLHSGCAAAAHYIITFGLPLPVVPPPEPGVAWEDPGDRSAALAWFRAEHQALIAATGRAADGFDSHGMLIPLVLRQFLTSGGYWQDSVTVMRTALAAACRLGDTVGQASAHCHLGNACTHLGAYQEAHFHLRRALALYQQVGDLRGQAVAHNCLATLLDWQRRRTDALHHAEKCLEQMQVAGDQRGEAAALNNVGWFHIKLGSVRQALPLIQHAASLQRHMDDGAGLAYTLDTLGLAHHRLGRNRQAIACCRRACALAREFAYRPLQAVILDHLGDAYQAAGEPQEARQAWEQARDLLADLNPGGAPDIQAKLAGISI
jgi:tetratricopeptide (TPR) repeat protein